MDKKSIMMYPNYKQIYTDIIKEKYPEKINDLRIKSRIEKINTVMDILELDALIFGKMNHTIECSNQKLRSYDKESVLQILNYQKKHKLSNTELANHFKMSRNTISKWKNIFK